MLLKLLYHNFVNKSRHSLVYHQAADRYTQHPPKSHSRLSALFQVKSLSLSLLCSVSLAENNNQLFSTPLPYHPKNHRGWAFCAMCRVLKPHSKASKKAEHKALLFYLVSVAGLVLGLRSSVSRRIWSSTGRPFNTASPSNPVKKKQQYPKAPLFLWSE